MPHRRTIACNHCGHLLLKRSSYCEVCGQITKRMKILWIAKTVQITAILVFAALIYWKVQHLSFP